MLGLGSQWEGSIYWVIISGCMETEGKSLPHGSAVKKPKIKQAREACFREFSIIPKAHFCGLFARRP